MSQEETQNYDEALKRAKECLKDGAITNVAIGYIETIFPELKESENKRIKEEIIAHIEWCKDHGYCAEEEMTRWVTFLEKQEDFGLHKKSTWSAEDEYYYGIIQYYLNDEGVGEKDKENAIDWFQSFKDRVQLKQEWSEEDCNQIEIIACHLDNIGDSAMAKSLLNIMDKYKK